MAAQLAAGRVPWCLQLAAGRVAGAVARPAMGPGPGARPLAQLAARRVARTVDRAPRRPVPALTPTHPGGGEKNGPRGEAARALALFHTLGFT